VQDVLRPFIEPQFLEAALQSVNHRVEGPAFAHDADAVPLPHLLGLGAERRGEQAARQRADECPSRGHWITSSAR
jgi:hypothetical protein